MGYDLFGRKIRTVNDWLNDARREKGLTQKNMDYLIEMKGLNQELKRIKMITYFLLTKCDVYGVRAIFTSANKQGDFIYKVIADLKKYGVSKEDEAAFDREIKRIRNRVEYVYPIIKENVRLTKYYPYFVERGFDRLLDYSLYRSAIDLDKEQERLFEDVQSWCSSHVEEVAAYEDSIRPEIEMLAERKRQILEKEKAEKKAIRDAKKAEDAEIKWMRDNKKAEQAREKRIERSFERYYKKPRKKGSGQSEHG